MGAGLAAPWHVASRLQEVRGEARANVLRAIGVAAFYAVEILNYRGLSLGSITLPPVEGVDASFHAVATAIAVAWISLCGLVFVAIRNRVLPPALKYVSTGADLALITTALTLADGPRSPMVVVFFLIIALAALRFSVKLCAFATAGAALGYLLSAGEVALRRPELTAPPHWIVTTLIAIVLLGVIVGQILRASRRAADTLSELEEEDRRRSHPEPHPDRADAPNGDEA